MILVMVLVIMLVMEMFLLAIMTYFIIRRRVVMLPEDIVLFLLNC